MPRCPEFIWNTLEVSEPKDAVAAFMSAAAGPGFLDRRPSQAYPDIAQTVLRKLSAPRQT